MPQPQESAAVPQIYAIGDIHGQLQMLQEAHARIEADGGAGATVVHVGDLVDRGPDSRGVIDYLMQAEAEDAPWIVLKGNHDRMMSLFVRHALRDERLRPDYIWLHQRLGATETLKSYGCDVTGLSPEEAQRKAHAAVPEAHLDYLDALPVSWETETLFFCHAGILPGVPLDMQTEDDLLWIRKEFHDSPRPHPKLIVHGHTPVKTVTHYGNRINIDTGAAYDGPLSVIVFDGDEVFELTDKGRVRLTP